MKVPFMKRYVGSERFRSEGSIHETLGSERFRSEGSIHETLGHVSKYVMCLHITCFVFHIACFLLLICPSEKFLSTSCWGFHMGLCCVFLVNGKWK